MQANLRERKADMQADNKTQQYLSTVQESQSSSVQIWSDPPYFDTFTDGNNMQSSVTHLWHLYTS